jgi:hypothetical protein
MYFSEVPFCCKSILRALPRNIDSPKTAAVQVRFVAPEIVILFLRQTYPPSSFATKSANTGRANGTADFTSQDPGSAQNTAQVGDARH